MHSILPRQNWPFRVNGSCDLVPQATAAPLTESLEEELLLSLAVASLCPCVASCCSTSTSASSLLGNAFLLLELCTLTRVPKTSAMFSSVDSSDLTPTAAEGYSKYAGA